MRSAQSGSWGRTSAWPFDSNRQREASQELNDESPDPTEEVTGTTRRQSKERRSDPAGSTLIAWCRTDSGYTTIKNVVTKEKGDLMPSYFLAETLKYLYLLFANDSDFDPRTVVFNTEAHPLRRTW